MFADTGINITTGGKRHLGAVIGSRSYTEEYMACKVEKWSEEIKKLAHIAQTQPHAPQLKRHVELAMEKGASSWLSVLPLDDHNFSLHKGAFKDAIYLRYGWKLLNTPTKCTCGTAFSTDHAIICPMRSFPSIRHNELRGVMASLLSEVCHNVATEPRLQPLSREPLIHHTTITCDDARLDIRAKGFWSAAQNAYFDVRIFHPNAPSNRSGSLSAAYKKHEDIQKRASGLRPMCP